MNKKEVSVLLIGTGGYGKNYADALLSAAGAAYADIEGRRLPYKVAGAVEIDPSAADGVKRYGVPVYDSICEFYKNDGADLAVISTPIHCHCGQIVQCLEHGSNVLCEKPMCATVEEAEIISQAEKAAGHFVMVGYQLSFSRAILSLKADIASGAFGKPITLKTIVHYPRDESYYARNNWAGRKRAADGRLILDSPLHNAVAHHINNMLFVLGDAPGTAVAPKIIQAELYRGNPDVDNFDTAALSCISDNGAEILFYTSHSLAKANSFGPICQFRFENATIVHIDEREHETYYAMLDSGKTIRYQPSGGGHMQKLWDCIDAAGGGPLPRSGIAAALPEVICVNGAQLSHPVITIPEEFVKRTGDPGKRMTSVDGLEDALLNCFERNRLPSELEEGLRPPWASPGKIVGVQDIKDVGRYI